ncbi:unnamed protein product [Mycetohabitans rhizoxinica HKI 454]|uniref:Uncharacterized protein n=1 Tax=Mycetohabitans rhizoxinica (strain DSM 19002 / CIP 109453 / HKI 454) TaxID=882378 RepID=E5AL55_MYCRK|nr:unnamed protein product [Mycetohabitans rhizoxinica HKI 454]
MVTHRRHPAGQAVSEQRTRSCYARPPPRLSRIVSNRPAYEATRCERARFYLSAAGRSCHRARMAWLAVVLDQHTTCRKGGRYGAIRSDRSFGAPHVQVGG